MHRVKVTDWQCCSEHVDGRPLGSRHLHRTVKKSLLIDVLEC